MFSRNCLHFVYSVISLFVQGGVCDGKEGAPPVPAPGGEEGGVETKTRAQGAQVWPV